MRDVQHAMRLRQAARLHDAGELAAAESLCHELLGKARRDVGAMQLLGSITFMRGDYPAAQRWLEQCARLDPRQPSHYCNLANALMAQGLADRALTQFDKALRLRRDDPTATAGKAGLLERLGRRDQARALLQPILEAGHENAEMAIVAAKLQYDARDDEPAAAMALKHANRPDVPPHLRRQLHFEAGRALERLDRPDQAFASFRAANDVVGSRFDPVQHRLEIDKLIETFSRRNLASLPRASVDAQAAIFIVGMWRSGSTLVEQIIDAHPQARGVGESQALPELSRHLMFELNSQWPWPECMGDLGQAAADRLGREYLDRLRHIDDTALRLIDKQLSNYERMGLIQALLPGAKVIHCRRDPMDTCFSCYVTNLSPRIHPYVTSLRHLGFVYRQYQRLMAHWRQALDLDVLEVVYEDLLAAGEAGIRRVIEFCGLPWDDRCLRFHESGRMVMTLSYDQVRRPMYQTSVRRCDRFAAHLGPLREALEEFAT